MKEREYEQVAKTLENIRQRIIWNIINKKRLDDLGVIYASGRTGASIEAVMRDDGGTLLGREHFEELETGIPPRQQPANFTDIILNWAKVKIERFASMEYKDQYREAMGIAWRIEHYGSVLYRDYGGRTDVFTPVIEDEVTKLETKLPNIVTETISEIIYGRQ